MKDRYFVTEPTPGGYAYWDVLDSGSPELGSPFSMATIYKDMPGAEHFARKICDYLNNQAVPAEQRGPVR